MGCALELNFPPPLLQLQSCNRKNRKVYRQTSASKTGIALRTGSARERAAAASVLRAWPSLCRRDKPAISLRGWRVVYFSEASREPLRAPSNRRDRAEVASRGLPSASRGTRCGGDNLLLPAYCP